MRRDAVIPHNFFFNVAFVKELYYEETTSSKDKSSTGSNNYLRSTDLFRSKIIEFNRSKYLEGRLRSILGLFSSFRAICRMDGMGWLSWVIGLLRAPSVPIS